MNQKEIKGVVEINLGMDNFCYLHTPNNRRVDLTEWMKKFSGKKVKIIVKELNEKEIKSKKGWGRSYGYPKPKKTNEKERSAK